MSSEDKWALLDGKLDGILRNQFYITIEQEERRKHLSQMLAEIERAVKEENSRPKKRFISPATREEMYALYYDTVRRKIEARGTSNFPEINGRKLYGELTMMITVNHDGRVFDTEVVESSGSRQVSSATVLMMVSMRV